MSDTEPTGHNPADGQLPEGWESVPIGTLSPNGDFFDGDWVESKDQDPTGAVRLTQLADIGEGNFRNRSDRWLRDDQAEHLNVNFLQEGDLLIARMPDPLGRCCALPKLEHHSVTVVDVAVLRIRSQSILNTFVMWILNSPIVRRRMVELASGTTRQRISRKNLSTIELPIPPLAEQERIVEILEEQLSRLDAALESVRVVREKAAQFRRSLLHAAFTGTLTGHNPADGQLPEGWEISTIGDVASFVRGVTYKKSEAREAAESGFIPLLRATNISSEVVSFNEYVYVPRSGVKGEQLLRQNDLVIATSSGSSSIVGKSAPILTNFEGTFGAFCAVLRPSSEVAPRYVHLFAQSPNVRDIWSNLARGTNINNLKSEQVLSTLIPLAPLAEQERIVEILEGQLSRLDAALAVADAIEKRSAALRRSLLHAAFTGRLTEKWRESVHV